MRSSDNGTMFLSEYMIMIQRSGDCTYDDVQKYQDIIRTCLNWNNNLCRAPGGMDQDSVDNHYAIFAAMRVFNVTALPLKIKQAMLSDFGFSNNERPGTIRGSDGRINWAAFLVRQPQLVAAMISASGSKRFYHFPLYLYAALVIATSCHKVDTGDLDARRLCWLLIQSVCPDSLMCRIASKIWFKRLTTQYNLPTATDVMRYIASKYYRDNHPFSRYWIA